jgi:hypothetical protein
MMQKFEKPIKEKSLRLLLKRKNGYVYQMVSNTSSGYRCKTAAGTYLPCSFKVK